jgi:hypothetical protein
MEIRRTNVDVERSGACAFTCWSKRCRAEVYGSATSRSRFCVAEDGLISANFTVNFGTRC